MERLGEAKELRRYRFTPIYNLVGCLDLALCPKDNGEVFLSEER